MGAVSKLVVLGVIIFHLSGKKIIILTEQYCSFWSSMMEIEEYLFSISIIFGN